MKIYITMGTLDFLKKIQEKNPGEKMLLVSNVDRALLLHETDGETVFNQPLRYEILESIGALNKAGTVVMNHIPVTDEGRPVFEYQSKMSVSSIESDPGFIALRFLKPLDSNTYVMITVWENERNYLDWESSPSYLGTNLKNLENEGPNIFESAPYKNLYTVAK